MLVRSSRTPADALPYSLKVCDTVSGVLVLPSLGFSLCQHMLGTYCKIAYMHLRQISDIRHLLTRSYWNSSVLSFVHAKFIAIAFFLVSLSTYWISSRILLLIFSASLITYLLFSIFSTGFLFLLESSTKPLCFNSVAAISIMSQLSLLSISRKFSTSIHHLESSALLATPVSPKFHLSDQKHFGQCSIAYQGPTTWDELPFSVRHSNSTVFFFFSNLKTHLFTRYYWKLLQQAVFILTTILCLFRTICVPPPLK